MWPNFLKGHWTRTNIRFQLLYHYYYERVILQPLSIHNNLNNVVGFPLQSVATYCRKIMSSESRASTQKFKENGPRESGQSKKGNFGQRRQYKSSSCSCCMLMWRTKNFPLALYDTDPAFKTPASSLSCFKKLQRTNPQIPLPVWLTSVSWSDQSLTNRAREKTYSLEFKTAHIFQSRRFHDMPSTTELSTDNSVNTSPSKRKLSSPLPNSPEKKILKQESDVMPSSVPSSPVKGSTGKDLSVGSPLRNLNFQKENEVLQKSIPKLQFAKLSEKAHAPTKGSQYAAGFDLKSAYEYTVPKRGSCLVKTDIQIKVPEGTYGRVAPRSGLALKNKIDVGAGVIDQDYRGNVGVILFNHGDEDFQISAGDRVAQLICEKIEYPEIEELKDLDATDRGDGGFGSTGIKS